MSSRSDLYNSIENRRNRFQRRVVRMAFQAQTAQTKDLIQKIKDGASPSDQLIDDMTKDAPIKAMFEDVWVMVAASFAKTTFKTIPRKQLKFEFPDATIQNIVRGYVATELAGKITNVSEFTKTRVKSIARIAIREGLGAEDTAKLIEKNVQQTYRNRGLTIARTEVAAASNYGNMQGAKLTGLDTEKEWIASVDSVTRGMSGEDSHDHAALDGVFVDTDALFTEPRTGEQLSFPGDSSHGASAGNIVNCRCAVGFREKR